MTPKVRAAMQQALDALCNAVKPKHGFYYSLTEVPIDCAYKYQNAITALREALDHSGEADEMVVGWDRVKPEAIASDPLYQQGFVDGVEEGRNQVAEQAEQEPVAYTNSDQLGYLKDPLYENAPMAMWSKPFDKRINVSLYAAPVRTKDLTDDELAGACGWKLGDPMFEWVVNIGRWAIAADREKNK